MAEMTPFERAITTLRDYKDGEIPTADMALRAIIAAIRGPISDAVDYLKADAEAWESGAEGSAHEIYLMHSGKLRRDIASRLDALLAEGLTPKQS